jgi:hypothetical protein
LAELTRLATPGVLAQMGTAARTLGQPGAATAVAQWLLGET